MGDKSRQAKIDYWKTIPPEERSRRASLAAKAKHAQMTPEERKAHSKKMAMARWGKLKALTN